MSYHNGRKAAAQVRNTQHDVDAAVAAHAVRNGSSPKHEQQADLALQTSHIKNLRPQSTAQYVALQIIKLFLSVRPENDEKRTALATRLTLQNLPSGMAKGSESDLGVQTANDALKEAHNLIANYRPGKLSKTR